MKMLSLYDAIKAVAMLLDDPNDTGMVWSNDVINNLVCAPSVMDAEPVRHGRWVIMRDRTLECSECKSIAPFDTDINGNVAFADEYDYCPWCGAKMDEDDTQYDK